MTNEEHQQAVQEAMYRFGYADGHAQRNPQEDACEPEWYARGYDDGFKASIGITWAVEHGGQD